MRWRCRSRRSAGGDRWRVAAIGRFADTQGLEIRPASFKFRDDAGDEIEFTGPYGEGENRAATGVAVDEFDFLHGATKVTAKITLPAPSTMHFFRFDDFADRAVYSDAEAFFADLTKCSSKSLPRSRMQVAAIYN